MRALSFIFLTMFCISCGTLEPPPTLTTTFPSHSSSNIGSSTPPLDILFFNIGQGDATLVTSPTGESFLIDGGPPGSGTDIQSRMEQAGQWPPDYTLATHYDLDHIGGLVELLLGPDATPRTADDVAPNVACFDRGVPVVSPTTPALRQYIDFHLPCRVLRAGETVDLGPVTIDWLAVNGEFADGTRVAIDPDDENAHSIVLRIRYQDFVYLHMADLPGGGGTPPYQTTDLESAVARLAGPIDVLHVGHHGSKTSTNATLLEQTTPRAAIISVGADNDYGHPHHEVIERLQDADVAIYTTRDGHLHLTSDGATFSITQESGP